MLAVFVHRKTADHDGDHEPRGCVAAGGSGLAGGTSPRVFLIEAHATRVSRGSGGVIRTHVAGAKTQRPSASRLRSGSGTRIRTWIARVRILRPTVSRSPNTKRLSYAVGAARREDVGVGVVGSCVSFRWWSRRDLNSHIAACKAGALPLCYDPVVHVRRFELLTFRAQAGRAARLRYTWIVRMAGFEPATPRLRNGYASQTALHPDAFQSADALSPKETRRLR